MATRLESGVARVIAEGKVRTYNMSVAVATRNRPTTAGKLWRGRERFHVAKALAEYAA